MSAARLFDVTVTRLGREEHVLRLEPENDTRRLEADAEKAVQVAYGAGAGGNPGELLAVLVERLLRLGYDEPEPAERELLAAFVRMLEQQIRSAAKAAPRLPALLEAEHGWRRVPTKLRTTAQKTLRRKLDRVRVALARIGYIRDPEKKPSLIDALNEGSWAGVRCGPNVVLLPWNSAADDARFEVVRRFLADRETEVRGVGQEKVSEENTLRTDAHLRSPETLRRAPNERRTASLNNGGGQLPRPGHRHAEAVEDEGSVPASPLREGEREPLPLLARRVESVRRREDAPEHRPGPARPRGVKKKRP